MSIPSGITCIDKPPGISSFQALSSLKKVLGTGKVGHTGTLDVFASGLLVVCIGRMTKLAQYITGLGKEYLATFRFGVETDTLDTEGKVLLEKEVPDIGTISAAAELFTGTLLQKPPAYSAVHIQGRRAYSLAREGLPVDIPERKVTIHRLSLLGWKPPDLSCSIKCSSGTYIRSLARDLGHTSGSCAYVTELRRTSIGMFTVEQAVHPESFNPDLHLLSERNCFEYLPGIRAAVVPDRYAEHIRTGKTPKEYWCSPTPERDGLWVLFGENENFLALMEKRSASFSYRFTAGSQ